MDNLVKRAIQKALEGKWKEAIELNKQVLSQDKNNIEALNRLGHAYVESGKINEAKKTYEKVLKLDPFNSIAQRALERIEKGHGKKKQGTEKTRDTSFLEEPGKTKTVSLIHLGDSEVIANLDAGEETSLVPHKHRVSIETMEGNYIGRLPDDLSSRLIKLIRGGNKYKAVIKSADPDAVRVFLKETERAPKYKDIPSFPTNEKVGYVAFTPPELVHEEKPEVSTFEDEESVD